MSPADRTSPPTVSVVVCTRNRPDMLGRLLASLAVHLPAGVDVVVVDSASDGPATGQVARAAGARVVRAERPGLTVARNLGVAAATGDVVAFTDDDCEAAPGWVEGLLSAFDDPRVGVVAGRMVDLEQGDVRDTGGAARRHFPTTVSGLDVGHGANMAFRRAALLDAGGFDEQLGAGTPLGGADDLDAFCRLIRRGWWARFEPSSVVLHRNVRLGSALVRLYAAYGRGLGAMAVKLVRIEPTVGAAVSVRILVRGVAGVVRQGRRGGWDAAAALASLVGTVHGAWVGIRLPLAGDVYAPDRCARPASGGTVRG